MPIDFGNIAAPTTFQRPTDPIALFQSLRVNDPAINDLWLAQGDALREWDKHRSARDLAIILNTGAGKTLVGLLAAQSLVNEMHGQVAYACSSLQLVQQTASKARGYGLDVSTYTTGTFSNDLYLRGLAPCVTTYQALFNGRSRFFHDDISAVVFDDAHTAGHLLREQFTLSLRSTAFPDTFSALVQLFRPYFTKTGQEMGYLETHDRQDATSSWFVPPFVIKQQLGELQRMLREASLAEITETTFAWQYLRNHIDLCAVFVSGTDVSFTPAVVPVRTLKYFSPDVRRLFLSATLAARDAFLRAFGTVPDQVIAPSTTAGECERLIILPALNPNLTDGVPAVAAAKQIIKDHKSVVLVPTRRRAHMWDDVAAKSDESVADQVDDFKNASTPMCLVLTARYDGLDLPGDTCRVMVIDDLPTGLNPLERFLWEKLALGKLLRSTVASRIVQSFGRISRGMSDHGVVVLTGGRLLEWILAPKNQALLPDFLQRQLQLGIHLSVQQRSPEDLVDAAKQCLTRDQGWIDFYQRSMVDFRPTARTSEDADEVVRITKGELDFGHALWERDLEGAAKALERGLEDTFQASRPTGAWHALWLGYTYELLGDGIRAQELYRRAHRAEVNIPAFDGPPAVTQQGSYSDQVLAVAASLQRAQVHLELPTRFDVELAALDGTGTVPQQEAALAALGEYLGLVGRRPDNELGTGPDVLWTASGGPAVSIEAKTDKRDTGLYRKDDLGQLRDHRQWVLNQLGQVEVRSVFVGPLLPASPDANPDPDIAVIELDVFKVLRDRLRAALIDISSAAVPITAAMTTEDIFQQRRLLWPSVFEDLPKLLLRDIPQRP